MDLFDFTKTLFRPTAYNTVKSHEKSKFFFMTNRFMSISYPVQANMFNHIRINQSEVMDYWHIQMSKLYKQPPSWMYTSSKSKTKSKKVKWPNEESIKIYLDKHQMSKRELEQSVNMFGEKALEPILKLEKALASNI